MLYCAIILAPTILLLNAFGISKIYKRFFKDTEIVKLYTFGLLSSIIVFCLPLIPIILFSVTLEFLNYYFLVIQIILLIIYIINWRWFIITLKINYKKLLVFLLIFISIFLGWFFSNNLSNFSNLHFESNESYINFLYSATQINASDIDLFIDQTNLINKPLIYNLFLSYLSIFKLNKEEIYFFVNIFSLSTYILFFSLVMMCVFYNNSYQGSLFKVICLCLLSLIASFFNMSLSNTLDSFGQWLMPLMLLIVWLHYSKYNEINSWLAIIFVNIISFMALSINVFFILPFTIINIINLGLSYYTKKQKATDYNIFNLFFIIITWTLLITKVQYLSIIIFIIVACFYIFYFFYRTSNFGIKLNDKIDKFMYKWIVMITCIIIFCVVFSIIIYYSFNGDFSNIFDKWQIISYFGLDIKKTPGLFWTINIVYWLLSIFILVYSIINIYLRKKRGKQFGYMELSLISILVVWNPFSLDLIDKLLGNNVFSIPLSNTHYLNLFLVPLIPLFINTAKTCINIQKKNIYNFSYLALLLSVTITSIVILNIM